MTWLVWRQHRKQLLFGVLGLGALAVFFLATGLPIHDRFDRLGLPDCLPETSREQLIVDLTGVAGVAGEGPGGVAGEGPAGVAAEGPAGVSATEADDATIAASRCAAIAHDFFSDYNNVVFAGLLLLVLPMLMGMFWGAPLVAREIEHGTHRLVWTQGVSRLRWTATKIGLVSIAVLAMTAIYAGMLTWWITPVIQTSGQRFDFVFFDIQGVVVFGYALFALALGMFAGAVTGRLLSAMAITVVGFLGLRLLVMLAGRPRYLSTETSRLPDIGDVHLRGEGFDVIVSQMRNDLHGDWVLSETDVLTIHPARHFWTFQAIETAIFVALAVALLAGTVAWVRRRSA
jgi:ABC-2 family transporter protein